MGLLLPGTGLGGVRVVISAPSTPLLSLPPSPSPPPPAAPLCPGTPPRAADHMHPHAGGSALPRGRQRCGPSEQRGHPQSRRTRGAGLRGGRRVVRVALSKLDNSGGWRRGGGNEEGDGRDGGGYQSRRIQEADLRGGMEGGGVVRSGQGDCIPPSPLSHLPPDRLSWVVYTRWGWERPRGLQ